MADSWITCARPPAAAAAGYDEDPKRPGVVWRMRLPTGTSRDIDILNLGPALAVELASNAPKVVENGKFNLRRSGDRWTATMGAKQIGTTLINAGFTPPNGHLPSWTGGPMPIRPDWGPIVLQVQVTRADGSMPGNDIGVTPEGQMDSNACWAASLAWWTRAVPTVLTRTQTDLIVAGAKKVNFDGTLSSQVILSFLASNSALRAELIKPDRLIPYLAAGRLPMIIGFASGPLGGHVNVIHKYEADKGTVTVMEPWFPDPVGNADYTMESDGPLPVFRNKKTDAIFKFTGKHLVRPVNYYTNRPLNGMLVSAASSDHPAVPN